MAGYTTPHDKIYLLNSDSEIIGFSQSFVFFPLNFFLSIFLAENMKKAMSKQKVALCLSLDLQFWSERNRFYLIRENKKKKQCDTIILKKLWLNSETFMCFFYLKIIEGLISFSN